jgi:hypothetical protein
MTRQARMVRWLVLCIVAASSTAFLAGTAASAAPTAPSSVGMTTAGEGAFTYDAPTITRVEGHALGVAEVGPVLLGEAREGSASRSVEARGASTTPSLLSNATNTAGTALRRVGTQLESVDDVIANPQLLGLARIGDHPPVASLAPR